MDKFERRWRALVRLKGQLGRGGATHIAREIDKEPSYISRTLYPPGKKGRKRIGEDTAELLDAKFPGWDSEEGWPGLGAATANKLNPAASRTPFPKGWGRLRDDQRAAIEQLIKTMLTNNILQTNTQPPPDGLTGD